MNKPGTSTRFLFKNADMSGIETHRAGPGLCTIFSARSPGKSGINEDAAAIISLGGSTAILIVADGVGGLPAGAWASALLVDTLDAACQKAENETLELRECLLSGIEEANRKIIESSNGSATTMAVVEIQGNRVRSYHTGDSMVLLTGQRGRIIAETVPHSPTGYAVESGILSENDAILHEDRNLVSNVMGSRAMHVSMSVPVSMKRFDTLLLATDGLFDNLERDVIIEIIRKGPLVECGEKLYTLVTEKMLGNTPPCKPDDLTFILFRPGSE